ncbi:TPA_exp: Uncharacterized protein A8136_7322 [Trichophyton benhamiae CBS 112371]|uniref:Uncharacterized protein n=1 Tax=Arthroderma benhamiae (strain ATCC MYA-4681 / CBS 112371) TaxID=663331 RepID=D4ATK3_ARTBC|nr:uncharacterized protein ARB_07567 [Trichophyton benhamiae CBS 112371]EFE33622.1 hypothetical protein ARB_07567 [Trichophyton benhamiae CBS 112371]DAA76645.1 TPA_exp: Uncharacterized protein A8136_7322 [Trichophyton benhamiae CBS 112371]
MDNLRTIFKRGDGKESGNNDLNPTLVNLLIALLAIILFTMALVGILMFLNRRRRLMQERRQSELPLYDKTTSRRRLTITATSYGQCMVDEKESSRPSSPVPEIRITFPEEEDAAGKRTSGRVVVVRIGEKGGIGLEPCNEDLPPYQSDSTERFQSLDLERMGGLKEKGDLKQYS